MSKHNIRIDQRIDTKAYRRLRAQVVAIQKKLVINGAATIRLRYPADAELLRLSVIGNDNDLTLLGDGVTLNVTPKIPVSG